MSHGIKTFYYQGQDVLILPAKLSSFSTLKAWLSTIATELVLSEKITKHLYIVADEIVANTASYAYAKEEDAIEPTMMIRVYFDSTVHTLTLIFSDNGSPFNPLEVEAPDILATAEERNVGGLGVFLVKKLMDSVTYAYMNGQNVLTLEKRIQYIER